MHLDGRPGIYSARYAGEEKSDEANIDKVLKELEGHQRIRKNSTICMCYSCCLPKQRTITVRGTCEGLYWD